jgi:hypothetical protein
MYMKSEKDRQKESRGTYDRRMVGDLLNAQSGLAESYIRPNTEEFSTGRGNKKVSKYWFDGK